MDEDMDEPRRRQRILLAEDDAELRRLVAASLRRDGYEIIELADGMQLLEYLSPFGLTGDPLPPPDLIVTDVRMPGLSGIELLRALRNADFFLPVIVVTAFGDLELHSEAHTLGAAAVFDKPFDLDDLRTAVVNILSPR